MRTAQEFRARGIVHGVASGPALVSPQAISFLGDIDIRTGEVVGAIAAIRGSSVAGRVVVIPHSVGSAGAWRFLYQLSVHGTAPVAIVQQALPDSSLVQGAILAKVPIVCEPEADLFAVIEPGDQVEVDGTRGVVRVTPGGDADAGG
jgi:predicted aconitase with swiveling domain